MHTQPHHHQRTSEILQAVIDKGENGGSISIGDFTALLGERAFALVILVFALPNSLPVPGIPGFSTVTGLPIAFIAMQMVLGRQTIWLPRKVAEKQFSEAKLAKLLAKAMPSIIAMERLLTPRWQIVCSPMGERLLGLLFVVLALIIALPIPGGNFLPGLSMALLALGLLERDGLFVSCAAGFSVLSIVIMYKLIVGGVEWLVRGVRGLF